MKVRLEVDVGAAFDAERAVESYMRDLGQRMQRAAEATGGREARARHRYRNRTHNLERSTAAYLTKESRNESTVELKPLAEYAIHVARRGFLDLTRAGELAEAAIDALALRGR